MREHLLFELDKYNKKRLSMEEEIEKITEEKANVSDKKVKKSVKKKTYSTGKF